MNIPAQLVEVANTIDQFGFRTEADILTNIASHLINQERVKKTVPQNMPSGMEQEWYNQTPQSESDDLALTDYMGRG